MTEETSNYNLLVKEWIPVLMTDGTYCRVNIRKALTQAGRIRQIAASNPMDRVAILRFLLALLYWCKGNPPDEGRATSGVAFPADWFLKLGDNEDCFNLLGEGKRFYQDPELLRERREGYRPIGDLLQEFPTETKIAHFRHARDGQYGLCPACCAVGIIRFCTFANAYGHGKYTSSVNGPTPAYAISQGLTLLQTLLLNWPENASQEREPPWLCDRSPAQADLDIVTVFAWRSRRLWLGDCGSSDEICSYCGKPARLIRRLAFTGNWKPPVQARGTQKKFWDQDPNLIFEEVSGKQSRVAEDTTSVESDDDYQSKAVGEAAAGKRKTITTLGFPAAGSRVAAHARFWRRALSARIARGADQGGHAAPLAISVGGPAATANRGLYQDAVAISLPGIPSSASACAQDLLGFLNNATLQLIGVLRQSTPNPDRQHPNRRAALDAQSPSLETWLRGEFDDWLRSRGSPMEGTPPAVEFRRDQLIERLRRAVESVVASTTPGSPLRRREARQRARDALREAVRQIQSATQKKGATT
jgi:hypothetical protein